MNMIDNHELPIGFTMELAQHSDILNRFAALSHEEQERYIDGSREVESRQEMKELRGKYVPRVTGRMR